MLPDENCLFLRGRESDAITFDRKIFDNQAETAAHSISPFQRKLLFRCAVFSTLYYSTVDINIDIKSFDVRESPF